MTHEEIQLIFHLCMWEKMRVHTHTHIDMLKGSAETVQVTEYFPNCFASQIFI